MTDKDLKMFKDLHGTELGKNLLDYFERLKVEVFNPEVVTKDNFDSRKEALGILEKYFIEKIRLQNPEKENPTNQYA
jgi:hypothetical protein